MTYRGPICAEIIALEGCRFFVAPTQVSSAFATKANGTVRQLSPATIEVCLNIVWVDVVAIFLEKNCVAKGKLLSATFYKSFDSEAVDVVARAPQVIDNVVNGRRLPFSLSP
jgi:hypothetical protein